MNVLVDMTYITRTSVSGVKNYALRLVEGFLQSNPSIKIILLATETNEKFLYDKFPGFPILRVGNHVKQFSGKLSFINGLILSGAVGPLLVKNNISCLLSPYLHAGSICTNKVPHIGVLHDAQWWILDKTRGWKGLLHRILMLQVLKSVRHIVTISESSKREIIKVIPGRNKPLTVIYNSVPLVDSFTSPPQSIPGRYILYVNTLMPYKNAETLVRAFASIKDIIGHNLIIKAKSTSYWNDVVLPLIDNLGIAERVSLIETDLSESEMASLYKNATVFVSTSTMEGFGYTPIEAAIHKVPVICAAENTLLETTRGLLNYYEPANNFQGLADKIKNIIFNPPQPNELLSISVCLANSYAPEKQVKQFERLLLQIVGEC